MFCCSATPTVRVSILVLGCLAFASYGRRAYEASKHVEDSAEAKIQQPQSKRRRSDLKPSESKSDLWGAPMPSVRKLALMLLPLLNPAVAIVFPTGVLKNRFGADAASMFSTVPTARTGGISDARSPFPRRGRSQMSVALHDLRRQIPLWDEAFIWDEGRDVIDENDTVEGDPYLLPDSKNAIQIWCDSSHHPTTGKGGAGAVIVGDANSGRWLLSTHIANDKLAANSLTAQWTAVEMALRALQSRFQQAGLQDAQRPVFVFSNSKPVVESCTRRVFTTDVLLSPERRHEAAAYILIDALERRLGAPVTFEWIRGHSGLGFSELAHRLAKAESGWEGRSAAEGKYY